MPQLLTDQVEAIGQAAYRCDDLLDELEQAIKDLDATRTVADGPQLSSVRVESIQRQIDSLVYQLERAGFVVAR